MKTKEIFYDFVNAINEHDVDKIYQLMDDAFVFLDSWGERTIGKDT
jgi:ketosteroid isomerase-like protein